MNLDYENDNLHLTQSVRAYLGQGVRLTKEEQETYLQLFTPVERNALKNNLRVYNMLTGTSLFHKANLSSMVLNRLWEIMCEKTVGVLRYQSPNETEVKEKLDEYYLSNKIAEAMEQATSTGRGVIALYEDDEPELEVYNAFRCQLKKKRDKIIEARLFKVFMSKEVGDDYILEEHRYLNNGKAYREHTITRLSYNKGNKEDCKTFERIENIPYWIEEQYPDVQFNKPFEIKGLGIYELRSKRGNTRYPDLDIPETPFNKAMDEAISTDTTMTSREVEKVNGRGQILLPTNFMKANPAMRGNTNIAYAEIMSYNVKNPAFTQYPSHSLESSAPQNIQFDIRAEAWETAMNGNIARLCALVGISVMDYDPRLLMSGQRTDDEINAMTDITSSTVKALRNLNTRAINQMLKDVSEVYKLTQPVAIRWDMSSILNPTKNTSLVSMQLASGLISRKEAIKRVNPDYTDAELDEMIKDIERERQAQGIETTFDNF